LEYRAAAKLESDSAERVGFTRTIPILRMFDERKAREFYCDFLGFTVEFEHRFEPNLPLYMGVRRAGLYLHLSEHPGDASPGSTVFVAMTGVHPFQHELSEKNYGYGRLGVERAPWGEVLEVHDPFGNRIRFCEMKT
jgi:catechol 2,3-dioxygenase-like lactoylglutathione lyase family enzyme